MCVVRWLLCSFSRSAAVPAGAGGPDSPKLDKFGAEVERLQQATQTVRVLCTDSVQTGVHGNLSSHTPYSAPPGPVCRTFCFAFRAAAAHSAHCCRLCCCCCCDGGCCCCCCRALSCAVSQVQGPVDSCSRSSSAQPAGVCMHSHQGKQPEGLRGVPGMGYTMAVE